MSESHIGLESDEMYTQYVDIVNELDHYPKELFIGKKILFPCDWDAIYNCGDRIQFETHNRINRIININPDADVPKCNFVKYFWDNYARFPENEIELFTSGYNPNDNKGINSLDCMVIDLSKYDWVITNPPFSFVTKFLKRLSDESERRKNTNNPFHFIIMIPWQSLGSALSNFFVEKKVFPGWGKHVNLTFLDINKSPICKNGKVVKVAIYWITDLDMNFPTVDNNYFIPIHKVSEKKHIYFDKRLYKEGVMLDGDGNPCASDGYPILVHSKVQDLYYDYPGFQAIPITCIDYYNPRVFEIFASTQLTSPTKEIGNFQTVPAAFGLQYKYVGLKKITAFLVKIRPEILEATKGKKPSEVFDACKQLLGIKGIEINE